MYIVFTLPACNAFISRNTRSYRAAESCGEGGIYMYMYMYVYIYNICPPPSFSVSLSLSPLPLPPPPLCVYLNGGNERG